MYVCGRVRVVAGCERGGGGGAFVHARVCVYLCAHVTVCEYVEQKMEEQ